MTNNSTSETPRTDEAAGHAMGIINERVLFCSRQLERELAHSLENQVKSRAEVEMFRKDNSALTYIGANLESHNWNLKRELESTEEALQQMTEDAVNLKVEVDRLRKQLQQAVEIAEKIWADCSNGSEHTKIAALKSEIK